MSIQSIGQAPVVNRDVSLQISRLMNMLCQFAGFRASVPIRRKLEKIFSQVPAADFAQWIKQVEADPLRSELVALVEDLTNHETYFFREKVHLDALSEHVLPALIAEKSTHPGLKKIVLWSAACSSGEEVYTLVMLALEAMARHGVAREVKPGEFVLAPEWSLEVHGTDISRQAIRLAKEAVYCERGDGLSSFRKFPANYYRFFDEVYPESTASMMPNSKTVDRSYYKVKASVSRYAQFKIFNLVSTSPALQDVDVIFCRNVLIYIELSVQNIIVTMLAQALRSGGVLMLGLVDTPDIGNLLVKSVLPQSVIYRKLAYVDR